MKFHSDFGILSWFHVPDLVILSCNNTVWYKQNFDEHLLQVLCTWIQNIPHTPKQTERKLKEKNKHWLKGPVVPYRTGATWLAQHVFRVSVSLLAKRIGILKGASTYSVCLEFLSYLCLEAFLLENTGHHFVRLEIGTATPLDSILTP